MEFYFDVLRYILTNYWLVFVILIVAYYIYNVNDD